MFDKKYYENIQKSMLESIDTMLLRNEYGVSGFVKDFATYCGNAAIFPEFFDGYNGDLVKRDFYLCPYNKDVLLGGKKIEEIDKNYCEVSCFRKIFEKDANLRREILERFKDNLQSGYYLECLENDKPIKPLLTEYEKAIFEAFWEEYEDNEIKPVDLKDRKTKSNFKDNLIYFDGTNDKPLDKELFEFWAKYMPEHKLEIERFKRTAGIPLVVVSNWTLVDNEYCEETETYEHTDYTPQTLDSYIERNDCRVKISLFDCVELEKPLFYFGLNFNGFVTPATDELKEFYNKWKDKADTTKPERFTIYIGDLNI